MLPHTLPVRPSGEQPDLVENLGGCVFIPPSIPPPSTTWTIEAPFPSPSLTATLHPVDQATETRRVLLTDKPLLLTVKSAVLPDQGAGLQWVSRGDAALHSICLISQPLSRTPVPQVALNSSVHLGRSCLFDVLRICHTVVQLPYVAGLDRQIPCSSLVGCREADRPGHSH